MFAQPHWCNMCPGMILRKSENGLHGVLFLFVWCHLSCAHCKNDAAVCSHPADVVPETLTLSKQRALNLSALRDVMVRM